MALLFLDSFDHYATADLTRKYDNQSGGAIVDSESTGNPDPRNGTQCVEYVNAGTTNLTKVFPSHTTWVMGVGIKSNGTISGSQDHDIFRVEDMTESSSSLDTQLSLQYNFDGKFRVVRGDDIQNFVLATSTGTFDFDNVWRFVEFQCVIGQSPDGSFSAQFDGVEIDGLTVTGVNTQNGANSFANAILLKPFLAGTMTKIWFDDYYIANGATPGIIAMLGDMKVDALFPRADGNYEELTSFPVQDDAFSLVNKLPPDADTTYVESNTNTEKSTFSMDEAANRVVHGVQHTLYVRKTDVNRRKIKHLTRIAGADYLGDNVRMGDKFTMKTKMWENNPQTGSQWTAGQVNGAEFGMEVAD